MTSELMAAIKGRLAAYDTARGWFKVRAARRAVEKYAPQDVAVLVEEVESLEEDLAKSRTYLGQVFAVRQVLNAYRVTPEGAPLAERVQTLITQRTQQSKALKQARALLQEAYNELNTIDAITVSPSDTDGLVELLRRIKEHLGDNK